MQILLVEDDPSHARVIRHALERHGHSVSLATTAAEGKAKRDETPYHVIIVDYVLPDATGLTLLETQPGRRPHPATVFLTATDSAEVCLAAIRAGAADYIVKGTEYLRTLPDRVAQVAQCGQSPRVTPLLKSFPGAPPASAALNQLLGSSTEMVQLRRTVLRAAQSNFPVLVEGPTGAGKEIVARAIHSISRGVSKPFIAINCAALPPDLFESEMFGHVKGAFTSALGDRGGLVLSAHEGSLFLDEVGELAFENQAKLLRLLQDLEFRPVGSDKQRRADVRVIAATNRPLQRGVGQREFREDLFYRLAVVQIIVPPLAQRSGDVRLLARAMVKSFAPRLGLMTPEIDEEAYQQLERHNWPGNVRELENVVKRTLASLEGTHISSFMITPGDAPSMSEDRSYLERLLVEFSGNLTQVGRELGVSRPTLYKRLKSLGIRPKGFRSRQ